MDNPFKISMAKNNTMKSWDLLVQVGGFKSKNDAEVAAKKLAEFLKGVTGWTERVQ